MTRENVLNKFLVTCDRFPNKKLFIYEEAENSNCLTGSNLKDKVKSWGTFLQKKVSSQETVLVLLPQGLDFITTLLACFYANIIAVPVPIAEFANKNQIIDKISYFLKDSKATYIITDNTLKESLSLDELNNSSIVLVEDLRNKNITLEEPRVQDEADLAILLYTSGSITTPKGVMINYKNLTYRISSSVTQWDVTKKSKLVTWLPQFHSFALDFNIFAPLFVGATCISFSTNSFISHPEKWFEIINKYNATHTAAPNFAFEHASRFIKFENVDRYSLSTLKAIISGGEPVIKKSYEQFYNKYKNLGLNYDALSPLYGLSEMGTVTTKKVGAKLNSINLDISSLEIGKIILSNDDGKSRSIFSCGEIGKDTEILIINPESFEECPLDTVGEIWINSSSVSRGYFDREKETKETFLANVKGHEKYYMRTGDLGFIHNKELFIFGRKKEVIIINGKNHYPADIEESIKNNLSSSALTCVFSQSLDNKERVIVVQEIDDLLTTDEYIKLSKEINQVVLENHGIPVYNIVFVNKGSIPKSSSGKIQRNMCRNSYLNNKLDEIYQNHQNEEIGNLNRITIEENIVDKIRSEVLYPFINWSLKGSEITTLDQLGLDSIKLIQISKEIERKFGIDFTPDLLFKYRDIHELALHILNKSENSVLNETQIQPDEIKRKDNLSENDIAIIGMSCQFPGGSSNLQKYWNNLVEQNNCITPISERRPEIFNHSEIYGDLVECFPNWAGFIDHFDKFDASFFGVSPKEAESMDPQQRKLLELTWSVIEDSGYNPNDFEGESVGLFVGVHNVDYAELIANQPELMETYGAYLDSGIHMSMIANRVSRWFNFTGPSEVVNTACSSSLVAVHHAIQSIYRGESNIAIAAGINSLFSSRIFQSSYMAGMLSKDGKCKTFDNDADGFVRAEGFGAVLLKSYTQALNDGDPIYGVIKATGINHDGRSNSLRAPNPNAQKQLIKGIFDKSGLDPASISYIETHGTGTSIGDPIEVRSLKEAYSELNPNLKDGFCGLGSVKTNIGHTESAAGIAGLIKIVLSMNHKIIPGNLHFKKTNSYIKLEDSPFYVVKENQEWKSQIDSSGNSLPLRAGISSFGFGGVNSHIIVEEYISERSNSEINSTSQQMLLIPLSAKNKQSLKDSAMQLLDFIKQFSLSLNNTENGLSYNDLCNISYTLQIGRATMNERIVFLISDTSDLIKKLNGFLEYGEFCVDQNVWTGGSERKVDRVAFFEEDIDELIGIWISKGRHDRVAQYWAEGGNINWNLFYAEKSPRRIHLPSYPFKRERFWLPDKKKDGIQKNSRVLQFERNYLERETYQESLHYGMTEDSVKKENVSNNFKEGKGKPSGINLSSEILYAESQLNPADSLGCSNSPSGNLVSVDETYITHNMGNIHRAFRGSENNKVNELVKELSKDLSEILLINPDDFDTNQRFSELGLDSITSIEWISLINKRYGLSVPATIIYDYPNILSFSDFLFSIINEKTVATNLITSSSDSFKDIEYILKDLYEGKIDIETGKQLIDTSSHAFLEEKLKTSLSKVLYINNREIDPFQNFYELGLDSILSVEWIKSINQDYETSVSATKIYDYPNIHELAVFLLSELKKKTSNGNDIETTTPLDDVLKCLYEGEIDIETAKQSLRERVLLI